MCFCGRSDVIPRGTTGHGPPAHDTPHETRFPIGLGINLNITATEPTTETRRRGADRTDPCG